MKKTQSPLISLKKIGNYLQNVNVPTVTYSKKHQASQLQNVAITICFKLRLTQVCTITGILVLDQIVHKSWQLHQLSLAM